MENALHSIKDQTIVQQKANTAVGVKPGAARTTAVTKLLSTPSTRAHTPPKQNAAGPVAVAIEASDTTGPTVGPNDKITATVTKLVSVRRVPR